jgi:hypothetical protein
MLSSPKPQHPPSQHGRLGVPVPPKQRIHALYEFCAIQFINTQQLTFDDDIEVTRAVTEPVISASPETLRLLYPVVSSSRLLNC